MHINCTDSSIAIHFGNMFIVKFFVIACLCAGRLCGNVTFQDLDLDTEWKQFKAVYGKLYSVEEDFDRQQVFQENVRYIHSHNLKADLNLSTYHLGINEFADLTTEEFVHYYKGLEQPSKREVYEKVFVAGEEAMPEQVDWRNRRLVTPVKNQGRCGSCWAFSAVASLEGQHAKATRQLVSLSEQNLVDCSGRYGNHGCNGGWMDKAFRYIRDNHGIDTEASYPYRYGNSGDNKHHHHHHHHKHHHHHGQCHFNPRTVGATLRTYVDVRRSENDLKAAVASVGPISVAIDASHGDFRFYRGGIYNPPRCSSTFLDHGVTVVGYGRDGGARLDYWLIKNSWGTSWGEAGYIKIVRNRGNRCGVASSASYPVV